jgi:hypothetical protein
MHPLMNSRLTAIALCCTLAVGHALRAQSTQPAPAPPKFPYIFTNFVWWQDDELRTDLKRRIPGLEDQIRLDSPMERRIRVTLQAMLREKHVIAEVQSLEPSPSAQWSPRDPEAPPLSIRFVNTARVIVSRLTFTGAPDAAINLEKNIQTSFLGKPWPERDVFVSGVRRELRSHGYLDADVTMRHDAPRLEDDHYAVAVEILVTAGPLYHIHSIHADGGPLLEGRDLSTFIPAVVGDSAGSSVFGTIAGQLRALYWRNGYASVDIATDSRVDPAHALVSYSLNVRPGPQYSLGKLIVQNLSPEKEQTFRDLFPLKTGDVFDYLAVGRISRELGDLSPDLAGYSYSFNFQPDIDAGPRAVDLTLTFFRQ